MSGFVPCICGLDFTGRNCSVRLDNCSCQTNATCIDGFASYTDANDLKVLLVKILDQCDPEPCANNGTCTKKQDGDNPDAIW